MLGVNGRVVKAQDGIPENVPQADGRVIMAVPLTDTTIAGNIHSGGVKCL